MVGEPDRSEVGRTAGFDCPVVGRGAGLSSAVRCHGCCQLSRISAVTEPPKLLPMTTTSASTDRCLEIGHQPSQVAWVQLPASRSRYVSVMSKDDALIRNRLEQERTHLLAQIDELTVGGEVTLEFDDDFADRAQVSGERGENRVLADTLQVQLNLVERALDRIDDGTYGTCTECHKAIGEDRLDALPATDRCIAHA